MPRVHTQEYVKPDDKEHKKPKFAGYEVHAHIGGGTFGDVYRAEWTRIQPSPRQHMAIKLLHKFGTYVKAGADTQREIAILKDIEHPNILGLIAWRDTYLNARLIMPSYDQDL